MDSGPPFLTKLMVPRRRPNVLRRPRLTERLSGLADGMIAVVRAPAGFGKTTLLVDLVHESPASAAWLTLDEWDCDLTRFLEYLSASVAHRLGESLPDHLTYAGAHPVAVLAEIANRIAGLGRDAWIVLDDFHAVEGSDEVLRHVDYLAQRLPANAALLLATRTPPPLASLPKLRLEGRVLEVGPADLAFTVEEIQRYYEAARDRSLAPDQASQVLEVTQGWPAAVALLDDPQQLQDLGSARQLAEYLAAELMNRLPPELQRFTLWTSVFDSLEPTACDAVTQDQSSGEVLRALETRNLPVMRVQERGMTAYRLHPILRDFLRANLRAEQGELYGELQRRAGEYLKSARRSDEAISHFAEAEDWDEVRSLISQEAPIAYQQGRWHTVTSWLELLPREELQRSVSLRIWEGRILVRFGQADAALRVIDESTRVPAVDAAVSAELESLRAAALRIKGDIPGALAAARRAMQLAVSGNSAIDTLAEARKQLALALFTGGSFAECEREIRAVLEIYEQRGNVEEAAVANACLGAALASLGKLPDSTVHLERARDQWRKLGNDKELSWTLNNLAMVYDLRGELATARDIFQEALLAARAAGYARIEAYALVSLADIDRKSGDVRNSAQGYEEALELCRNLGEMTLATHALVGLSETFRTRGDTPRAEGVARQALVSAEERNNPYERGLALVALARVLRDTGRREECLRCLTTASALFEGTAAHRELAECLFERADALFASRRSRTHLRTVLEVIPPLAAGIGYDTFLVELARRSPPVVEYAASRRIGGEYYRDLLRRALSTPVVERRLSSGDASGRRLPVIEVRALGGFEAKVDDRPVLNLEWESGKSKELLLLMLVTQRPLERDQIIASLWPDAGGRKASGSFHSTLYRVRRALYPECVIETGGAYSLNPLGSFEFDVWKFQRLTQEASDDAQPADRLRKAVELHLGPFAPGVDSEWARDLRLRLDEAFIEAGSRLADLLSERRQFKELVTVCEKLLSHDPYNESACLRLMRALASVGDVEAALRAYRRYAHVLRAELDESPSDRARELYEHLRLRRASLSPP